MDNLGIKLKKDFEEKDKILDEVISKGQYFCEKESEEVLISKIKYEQHIETRRITIEQFFEEIAKIKEVLE